MKKRSFTPLLILLTGFVLVGCGRMIQGNMYRLSDGAAFPFQIETSYGKGSLAAQDPITGEQFTGEYTGQYQGGGSTQSTVYNATLKKVGTVESYSPPTSANARGILRGTMGTVIQVYLDITPGVNPTGSGEGVDNKGNVYQIQF